MDTRKYTEKSYITEDYLEKLKDATFLVVSKGQEVTYKFQGRDIKGFQLLVSFAETKDMKEWTMNTASLKAWQESFGYASEGWFEKKGKFVQQTIDGKVVWVGIPLSIQA